MDYSELSILSVLSAISPFPWTPAYANSATAVAVNREEY